MHEEALAQLEAGTATRRLRDPLGVKEQQARLYLALGRRDDAAAAYRRLIAINTENYRYHAGLQAALQLPQAAGTAAVSEQQQQPGGSGGAVSEEQRERLTAVYGELQAEHPHSVTMRRMPLDFLVGVDG